MRAQGSGEEHGPALVYLGLVPPILLLPNPRDPPAYLLQPKHILTHKAVHTHTHTHGTTNIHTHAHTHTHSRDFRN